MSGCQHKSLMRCPWCAMQADHELIASLREDIARLTAEGNAKERMAMEAYDRLSEVNREVDRLTAEGKELRAKLEAATIPYCLGIETIRRVANEGQLALDSGHAFIAASDLYKQDPYDQLAEARRRLGLAEEWLEYDTYAGPNHRAAVLEKREAFRASLPAPSRNEETARVSETPKPSGGRRC